jgi:hypothetical protein
MARAALTRRSSRCRYFAAAGTLLVAGCIATTTASSGVSTSVPQPSSTAPVTLSATRDPERGQQVGLAEAHGRLPPATLETVAMEFASRVAQLGGDYGRIDAFGTRFETVTESYTYDCGTTMTVGTSADGVPITTYIPQSCTGYYDVEVGTLTLTGRAFRTQGATP